MSCPRKADVDRLHRPPRSFCHSAELASRTVPLILLFVAFCFPCAVRADSSTTPDPIIQETLRAIQSNSLATLKTSLDQRCYRTLVFASDSNSPQILKLAACREFSRYFSAMQNPTPEQRETLSWLAEQPHLMPTLMSAVSAKDPPERLLDVIDQLRNRDPNRADLYPDLATAISVVYDKSSPPDDTNRDFKFDRDRPVMVFDYFSDPRNRTRFDLRTLPWQLELYIVDLKVSPDEMQWAVNRYGNNYSIADLYFEVVYDEPAFENGADKAIASHPYTLQNILQYGGVCVEQAYFSSQVAKTLGIPACTCSSRGGGSGEVAHAWLGLLTQQNGKAMWDFDQGRYKEDLFWAANIVDPQTHDTLTDSDIGLLAELQNVSPSVRRSAALELKLADLLPPIRRVDLCLRELERSPGDPAPWIALADLGAKKQLTPAETQTFAHDIDAILINSFPDFAFEMLVHFVSAEPPADRIASLDRIALEFPARPDLKARIRLLQADILLSTNQTDQALKALADVLTNELNAGPIILSALNRVEKIMRVENNPQRLALIYAEVWPKIPAPDRSAFVYETPYFIVGRKYMALLESLNDRPGADAVRQRLSQLLPDGAVLK
jgi:hypothetical protein